MDKYDLVEAALSFLKEIPMCATTGWTLEGRLLMQENNYDPILFRTGNPQRKIRGYSCAREGRVGSDFR